MSVFWDRYNKGQRYLCDRCKVVELSYDEWDKNRNLNGIYCQECWNWIHIQTWEDETGKHSLRSERKINKIELSEKFS